LQYFGADCVAILGSVVREVVRGICEQAIFPTLLPKDDFPKLGWVGVEDEVNAGGVGQPSFAFHLIFELTGGPARITSKDAELFGSRVSRSDLVKRIQGVAKA